MPNNRLSFRKSSILARSMSEGTTDTQSEVSISFGAGSLDNSESDAAFGILSTVGVDEADSSDAGDGGTGVDTVEG